MLRERKVFVTGPTNYEEIARRAYRVSESNASQTQEIVSAIKAANPDIQKPEPNNLVSLPAIAGVEFQGFTEPLYEDQLPDPTIPSEPKWNPTGPLTREYEVQITGVPEVKGCRFIYYWAHRRDGMQLGPKTVLKQFIVVTFDQVAQVQHGIGPAELSTTIWHYTLKLYNKIVQSRFQLWQSVEVVEKICPDGSSSKEEYVRGDPFWVKLPDSTFEELVGTLTEWWSTTRKDTIKKLRNTPRTLTCRSRILK